MRLTSCTHTHLVRVITFNKGLFQTMKKSLYLAAAAVLALGSPAFAGNDNGPKGGDSSANAGAVAGAAAGAISGSSSNAVGGGALVTGNNNGGDGGNATSSATGGAGGRADASSSSSLGSLNKFGGDGGSVVGSGNSANHNSNTNLLGQGQVASSDQGQSQSQGQSQQQSQASTQANQQTATAQGGASNSGGNTLSNVTNYERAPVSSAIAIGSAGVGDGMCRFGPGVGAQGITAGYTFSLPIFKDKLCSEIAKDSALIRKASFVAQVAGNEAAVQYIASKDADVSRAITCARKPESCTVAKK